LLIHNNLLAWHAEAGETEEVLDYARGLDQALTESGQIDDEIRRISHFNLAQAYELLGLEAPAGEHSRRWRQIHTGLDEQFWACRRGEGTGPATRRRFGMRFYPIYLSHWHLGTVPFDAVPDDS